MNPTERTHGRLPVIGLAMLLVSPGVGITADWPTWGGDEFRNMTSEEAGLPTRFEPGTMDWETERIDPATTKNVKWIAKTGSQTYGNPTVARGRVFIGTNNESPRDPNHEGDRGVVYCLDEDSGDLIWQLVVPKLGTGKVSDWEYLGICSSPTVDGDRVYVVTNRCEVVCLDFEGLANGNDGPFTDELAAVQVEGKPAKLGEKDADILWIYDMREELGIFPHNIASSSVLIVGDRLYVTTSNGVDWSHVYIPNPNAPCLAVLDKKSGKLLGEEASGISQNILHSNWSSPTYGKQGDEEWILFGGGDGWLYGFDPVPVQKTEDGETFGVLEEEFKIDLNPAHYREKDGEPIKYATPEGPSEVIATPVYDEGRVYIAIGQDPEHGMGIGMLTCVDPTMEGDITGKGAIWTYEMDRSISTVAIQGDLLFAADFTGYVHCLDKKTGKRHWKHDTESNIWSSPYVADGKVYMGNEDGVLTVLSASKELEVLETIEMGAPVYSSPVAANSTLYITTQTHLFAIARTE